MAFRLPKWDRQPVCGTNAPGMAPIRPVTPGFGFAWTVRSRMDELKMRFMRIAVSD